MHPWPPLQQQQQSAAAAAGRHQPQDEAAKWAKGVQQGARGDVWAMAFQIRGKRHPLTLRCSQAEAAVGYDLAGFWCHKAKGNDPARCTRYNFPLAWYPRRLLEELLGLGDWEAVRACIVRLQGSGILQQLVPFEGVGERYSITDVESWRPQPGLQLCINARGIHFYRGSWSCVLMEDVSRFGAADGLLHLTYTPPNARPGHLGATSATFRCQGAADAHQELRAAAAERRLAGLGAPRDLGSCIPLPRPAWRGGGRGGRGRGAAPEQSQEHSSGGEEEEEDECDGTAAGAGGTDYGGSNNPSLEELELFAGFAEIARTELSGGGNDCSGDDCSGGSGREASPPSTTIGGTAAADQRQEQERQDWGQGPEAQADAACLEQAGSTPAALTGAAAALPPPAAAAAVLPGSGVTHSSGSARLTNELKREGSPQNSIGAGGHGTTRQPSPEPQEQEGPALKKQRSQHSSESQQTNHGPPPQQQPDLQQQQQQPDLQQQQPDLQQQQQMQMLLMQQLMAAQQRQQQMQMWQQQLGGMRLPQMVAMPPAMAAALKQHHEAALAGGAAAAAAAARGTGSCFPLPQMALLPMPAPMMGHMPPAWAAAIQAQAAARQMAAAAGASAAPDPHPFALSMVALPAGLAAAHAAGLPTSSAGATAAASLRQVPPGGGRGLCLSVARGVNIVLSK